MGVNMIAGLGNILQQREEQFGGMQQKQPIAKDNDEAIKLLFEYIQKSNAQIMSTCVNILNNQKTFSEEIEKINEKLDKIKV